MENREKAIGIVSATMAQLKEAGRGEYCQPGVPESTVLASVMNPEELQAYYDKQLGV